MGELHVVLDKLLLEALDDLKENQNFSSIFLRENICFPYFSFQKVLLAVPNVDLLGAKLGKVLLARALEPLKKSKFVFLARSGINYNTLPRIQPVVPHLLDYPLGDQAAALVVKVGVVHVLLYNYFF